MSASNNCVVVPGSGGSAPSDVSAPSSGVSAFSDVAAPNRCVSAPSDFYKRSLSVQSVGPGPSLLQITRSRSVRSNLTGNSGRSVLELRMIGLDRDRATLILQLSRMAGIWISLGSCILAISKKQENLQFYASSFYSLNTFCSTYGNSIEHPHNSEPVGTFGLGV
jgi:hypothetical protein